jgi:hypothetical protein
MNCDQPKGELEAETPLVIVAFDRITGLTYRLSRLQQEFCLCLQAFITV